jgi:hypothetical protein
LCGGVGRERSADLRVCLIVTESILNRIGKDVSKASLRTALVNFMIGGVSLVAGYLHPFGQGKSFWIAPLTMASVTEADGNLSITR